MCVCVQAPYQCHYPGAGKCNSDTDCPKSYCMSGKDKAIPYSCHGASLAEAAPQPADETCFHDVDAEDHKCFEACAPVKFATKGITSDGKCPASYNTVDKTAVVYQCPDGVTNVRYCASTALNVTIATKGEAGGRGSVAWESFMGGARTVEDLEGTSCTSDKVWRCLAS